MGNKSRGFVTVKFRGKDFDLRLTSNSICIIEGLEGCTIHDIMNTVSGRSGGPSFSAVRRMFWALMLHKMPEATLEDAGELMDGLEGKHEQIMLDGVKGAFPQEGEGDTGGKPRVLRAGTG